MIHPRELEARWRAGVERKRRLEAALGRGEPISAADAEWLGKVNRALLRLGLSEAVNGYERELALNDAALELEGLVDHAQWALRLARRRGVGERRAEIRLAALREALAKVEALRYRASLRVV